MKREDSPGTKGLPWYKRTPLVQNDSPGTKGHPWYKMTPLVLSDSPGIRKNWEWRQGTFWNHNKKSHQKNVNWKVVFVFLLTEQIGTILEIKENKSKYKPIFPHFLSKSSRILASVYYPVLEPKSGCLRRQKKPFFSPKVVPVIGLILDGNSENDAHG